MSEIPDTSQIVDILPPKFEISSVTISVANLYGNMHGARNCTEFCFEYIKFTDF